MHAEAARKVVVVAAVVEVIAAAASRGCMQSSKWYWRQLWCATASGVVGCCGCKCYAGTEAANAGVVVMLASGQRVVGWDKPSELWTKATAFGAPNQMQ